jgi:hypoxanthine-DNA glycosylase
VLVLGTLPGQMSLARQQYYAQPRNALWPILATVCGFDAELPYARRVAQVRAAKLAIWDVCALAERPGSLDADIARDSIVPNDFAAFFARHRAIALIAHNGATSAALYERLVLPTLPKRATLIRRVVLPSTSPAHAAMPFAEKLRRWRDAIAPVLDARSASKTG